VSDGGGGGGGGPDCAGKKIELNHNVTVSSDATGAINEVDVRLNEDELVQIPSKGDSPGFIVARNSWANVTLAPNGAVTVGVTNGVLIEKSAIGAAVTSATFNVDPAAHNNGNFTEVKGAVSVFSLITLGSMDTPSDFLKDKFNESSQLANIFSTLRALMQLINQTFNCAGIKKP